MKAKIDEHGWLSIERAGKWREAHCPFSSDLNERCGDWCPLMKEYIHKTPEERTIELYCAHTVPMILDVCADERWPPEKPQPPKGRIIKELEL